MRARPRPAPAIEHFALDPSVVFLNHGSFGACPKFVLDAQAALRAELEANPVRFLARELPSRLDEARRQLAAFVHARPENLVFTANATSGVNAVLRSIRWRRGDVVLTTNQDYVGCRSALLEVAAREGLEVRVVSLPFPGIDPDLVLERVVAAAGPDVRLALLDHVTSTTGLVLPIERLVRELEGRGIAVLVDGAHAPGMVPLALDALSASYYAGNAHKWAWAPKGTALLHVRDDRKADLVPGTISIGTRFPKPGRDPFHERFDWQGTTDPTAWLSLGAALAFPERVVEGGFEAVRAHNASMVRRARARLLERLGLDAPAPDTMIASMVSLPLPPRLATVADGTPGATFSPLGLRLAEEFGIEVPVSRFEDRWVLRFTAQIYNSDAQYDYLADALVALGGG